MRHKTYKSDVDQFMFTRWRLDGFSPRGKLRLKLWIAQKCPDVSMITPGQFLGEPIAETQKRCHEALLMAQYVQ